MRPSARQMVTPGLLVWTVLPPERRAAVVSLLGMLAAGLRRERRKAVAMSLARYRMRGAAAAEDPPGSPGPGRDGLRPPVEQAAGA